MEKLIFDFSSHIFAVRISEVFFHIPRVAILCTPSIWLCLVFDLRVENLRVEIRSLKANFIKFEAHNSR